MGFHEMYKLAQINMQGCLLLEKDFPQQYAVLLAVYHLRQAVEMELKTLLLLRGREPTATHDIAELAAACRQEKFPIPESVIDMADTLTQWESVRYDPFLDLTGDEYAKAKAAYTKLHAQTQKLLRFVKE